MDMQVGVDRGIGWTDATWNPLAGCLYACSYCYASELADGELRAEYLANPNVVPWCDNADPFMPRWWPEQLDAPRGWSKGIKILTVDQGDLFGSWVPQTWIWRVLGVVRDCPRHTFQFLTKAPQNLARWNPWPGNAWVGATVDVRHRLQPTLDAMRMVEATVRFLAFEPLLEDMGEPDLQGIDWVIIGALAGEHPRQPQRQWTQRLVAAAIDAGAALFLNNTLVWPTRVRDFPQAQRAEQLSLL
jgi:protein gp37